MPDKPTYEELEERVTTLEKEAGRCKQIEQQLKQLKEFLNTVIESLPHPFYVINASDYTISLANRFARLEHLTEETTCYALTHGRDRPCSAAEHPCPLEEVKKAKQPVTVQHLHYDKDGNPRSVEVHAYPVFDSEGKVCKVVETSIDITERQRSQEALRELEKKFHAVAHSANDAIISSDSLGNTVFWNSAAQKMFGYTPEEIIGQPLTVLMPERYRGPHEERMKLHTSTGESKVLGQTVELTGLRKDGSEFPLELSLAMWKAGQEVFYTGIIRDISKRKAAQEALLKARDELEQRVEERTAKLAKTTEQLKSELRERRQAENALSVAHKNLEEKAGTLEEVNEELSQYVHIASHDLKSMLQGIHIYADLLNEDLETILDGDQKEYLQGLTRTVGRSEQLADDLLELSQVGRGSVSVKPVNTAMLFRELIASLDLSPDVEVSMDNNLPTINTDPNLLEHAFRNLITNAIKFNDAERKQVEIGWNPVGEDSYELFVRDNGIGIEVRFHEQVFDVFKRLHAHRKYEGTGLGLAIVKKAVAKLNGSVRIESEVGKGSTFFVTLPRSQTTS